MKDVRIVKMDIHRRYQNNAVRGAGGMERYMQLSDQLLMRITAGFFFRFQALVVLPAAHRPSLPHTQVPRMRHRIGAAGGVLPVIYSYYEQ